MRERRKQMKVFRMLSVLTICGVFISSNAYATSISAGETVVAAPLSFGGTLIAAAPSTLTGPVIFGSLIAGVYSDPSNVYCAGCLDFVYLFGDSGGFPVTGLFVATFDGFPLDVGFSAIPNGIAPTTIAREPDGDGILFNFSSGLADGQFSDVLVIQTPATSYTYGSATLEARGGTFGAGGQGFQPTPEPSSIVFLSTGLLGFVRVIAGQLAGKK
jgi:hypothetical protein